MDSSHIPPMAQGQISDRVTRIETIVGDTSDEGIRGEIKVLRTDVSQINDSIKNLYKHLYMAVGGAAVGIWVLNQALVLVK